MIKSGRKLRILIADDHELMRRGIRSALRSRPNWTVVAEAKNGAQAAKKAEVLHPDVAVLDVFMPETDGIEATRLIRRTVPECQIIVLTLHDSEVMIRRVLQAGARGYVLKSDVARHLSKAVERISKGKTYLSPTVSEIVVSGLGKRTRAIDGVPETTRREKEVLHHIACGQATKEIACDLGLSSRTVEQYRARIMKKLHLNSFAALVRFAVENEMSAQLPNEFAGAEERAKRSVDPPAQL